MWTDREYWKHLVKKEPLRYNYLDCVAEWEAFTRLRTWCKSRDPKVWEVYERDRQLIPVAVHLHLNGMPFSEEAHLHEQEYYEKRRESVEGELRTVLEGMRTPIADHPELCPIHPKYGGHTPLRCRKGEQSICSKCSEIRAWVEASKPLNIRSRKQMMELFEANAIAIPTDRKTKEKKFDKAALAAIMRKVDPATARTVGRLLEWKRDDKVLSSYFRRDDDGKAILPCLGGGRIHAIYQLHTAMGRWSCQRPNLQQLKRPEEE
jgi:hypothetical protein